MVRIVSQIAARTLTLPGVVPLVQRWNRDVSVVFMLHRLADPERGVDGQDPLALRHALALLRRHRFQILRVDELVRQARSPDRPPGPRVAFTLDDGYREQAEVGRALFSEFDAPATIFPVTDFLDGTSWMWWDRAHYLVQTTAREHAHLPVPGPTGGAGPTPLTTPAERRHAEDAVVRHMKRLTVDGREALLVEVAEVLDVELPEAPPGPYAPMTWQQARRCEQAGVSIGPHTMSHPTLSNESEERARIEISGSWRRLCQELEDPVPVFCYPNGRRGDFGDREARLLEAAGMPGALTAEPGYIASPSGHSEVGEPGPDAPASLYALPRFSFPSLSTSLVRIISGLAGSGRHRLPGAAPAEGALSPSPLGPTGA